MVQVRRGLEAPHCGQVDHRFRDGNKSFYNQMSERKEGDDMSSVRCNEVQI